MTVESMLTPQNANVANPAVGDDLAEGDDHLRGIKVMLKKLAYEQVGTIAASGAASINTASSIGAFVLGYDYILTGERIYASTIGILNLRVTNSGTADSGNNYGYAIIHASGGGAVSQSAGAAASSIPITGAISIGDATTETARISVTMLNPMSTSSPREMDISGSQINNGAGSMASYAGGGSYVSSTAADGIVIYPASGTFTGTFNLYRRFRPV